MRRTAQVHPFNEQNFISATASRLQRVCSLLNQLDHKWSDLQVGRQGKYSIERLESLDYYCKTMSQTRVILVCVLTPLPVLVTNVLLECLPLRSPSEGLVANWVFTVRITLVIFILTLVMTSQLKRAVPDLGLTSRKKLIIATGAAVCQFGLLILNVTIVGFPLPFTMQAGFFPYAISMVAMLILTVGKAPFRRDSPCRTELNRFLKFFSATGMLMAVYPLFKVLYDRVPAKYQGCATLLLPLWKFGAKKLMVSAAREQEDFIPQIVAFAADFFCTLFVSVCMFSAASVSVSMLVIATDLLQSALEYREVQMNADAVHKLLLGADYYELHTRFSKQKQDGVLLRLILEVSRNPLLYNINSLADVRLWACSPHSVSSDVMETLKSLETFGIYESGCRTSTLIERGALQNSRKRRSQTVIITPAPVGPVTQSLERPLLVQTNKKIHPASKDNVHPSGSLRVFIVQGLQLLFHCEYLALVEYIECVIPIVFVVYKSVLHKLPNIVYYPGGASAWTAKAVANIMLFSMLEIGSFVALNMLLQRKFAFSPLYQLAFVLETQFVFIQAALFLAGFCLLPYELEHLGADFSLRFEWLRST